MSFFDYSPLAYKYRVCCECTEQERAILQYVYPLKQETVLSILRYADFSNVVRCILIGSSISMRCNNESDIDLVVFLKSNDTDLLSFSNSILQYDGNVDFIIGNHFTRDDRLWSEIENGLVLWERK